MLKFILMWSLMINSMMFLYSKTPISMGLLLLLMTMLIAFFSGMMSMNFWYTYIMFLIMIGGMLILFIYTSSLSSNQKFNFNKNNIYLFLMMFVLTLMMMLILNKTLYSSFNYDSMEFFKMNFENNMKLKMSMNKLYNLPTNQVMILTINYLLMTLFITVENTNINMGPLRKNL